MKKAKPQTSTINKTFLFLVFKETKLFQHLGKKIITSHGPWLASSRLRGFTMTFKNTNSDSKRNLIAAGLGALLILSIGCAKSSQFPTNSTKESTNGATAPDNSAANSQDSSNSDSSGHSSNPSSSTSSGTSTASAYQVLPLSWESATHPERRKWSSYLEEIILNQWSSLLNGANDIESFCPRYFQLDNFQRANVWAALFSGVANYESAYNPLTRFQESTMGTDPITRKPVYSEGLLQLSYQDIQAYPFCEFDWNKDKSLSATSAQKTILDPLKNLYCGVGIMAKQITRKGHITLTSGAYWSTLQSGGRYQKISGIQNIVKKISFCN